MLVADSKEAAIASLRKQNIIVTAVTEKGKEFALPKLGGGVEGFNIDMIAAIGAKMGRPIEVFAGGDGSQS